MDKDAKQLIEAARRAGWRIEETRKGLMLYPTDRTLGPVLVHHTPSDHRALKNLRAELRRRGLDV